MISWAVYRSFPATVTSLIRKNTTQATTRATATAKMEKIRYRPLKRPRRLRLELCLRCRAMCGFTSCSFVASRG